MSDENVIKDTPVESETMTNEEYMTLLRQRGLEKLSECDDITSFEGECEATIMFKYGVDFFKGDIVQIANEYGHHANHFCRHLPSGCVYGGRCAADPVRLM